MSCEHCPCPETCLKWEAFCLWAKEGDPIKLRHICARSALGVVLPKLDRSKAVGVKVDYGNEPGVKPCCH